MTALIGYSGEIAKNRRFSTICCMPSGVELVDDHPTIMTERNAIQSISRIQPEAYVQLEPTRAVGATVKTRSASRGASQVGDPVTVAMEIRQASGRTRRSGISRRRRRRSTKYSLSNRLPRFSNLSLGSVQNSVRSVKPRGAAGHAIAFRPRSDPSDESR